MKILRKLSYKIYIWKKWNSVLSNFLENISYNQIFSGVRDFTGLYIGMVQGDIRYLIWPITTQNNNLTSSLLAVSGSTGGTGGVYSFTVGEGVAGTPSANVSFSCSTRQKYIYPYHIEAWKFVYFPQMIFNQTFTWAHSAFYIGS